MNEENGEDEISQEGIRNEAPEVILNGENENLEPERPSRSNSPWPQRTGKIIILLT